MIERLRARPLRGFMCGVAFLALVFGLLVATEVVPGGRASAGGGGTPYGVYVTTGAAEVEVPTDNIAGSASKVVTPAGGQLVTATALNATASLGVATAEGDGPQLSDVAIFSVPSNASFGSISGVEPSAYAADPIDPNTMFAVDGNANVYKLTLASGNQTAPAAIASVSPSASSSVSCSSIAVTPDGTELIVGCENFTGSSPYLAEVNTSTHKVALVNLPRPADVDTIEDLAIAPNGSALYVVTQGGTSYLVAFSLPLTGALVWRVVTTAPVSQATTVTVSPSGSTVYVGGYGAANAPSSVATFSSSSGVLGQSASVPITSNGQSGLSGIALTPDGATLYATGASTSAAGALSELCPVATSGLVPSSCASFGSSTPTGPEDVAVTPDQAPQAGLTSVSGTAGSPVNFDASSSTVEYRTITNYSWTFGDGSPIVNTAGPTVSHTYGSQGTYTATVTVTDAAGTSVPPASPAPGAVDGPGTTPYLDASSSAALSEQVPVSKQGTPPPPPPTTTTTVKKQNNNKPTTTTSTTLPGTPTITLQPTVGPPGTIVNVSGQGFPPNRNVTVSWSTNTGSYTEMTDAHGNLPSHVFYVLVPDVLGPRQAVASTNGVPPAKANFLVVIRTSEPGGSLGAAFFRAEGE